jgi:hypothetical protein
MAGLIHTTTLSAPGVPLPASLANDPRATGHGISTTAVDLLTPMLTLLQQTSPPCNARDSAYIDGASGGMFYCRATGLLADELEVIFVDQQHAWIEFLPLRGGFVARHSEPPNDLIEMPVEGKRRPLTVRRDSKNVVEHVRELYLLANGEPMLFSCTSTKHTFAREQQTYMHQFKDPATGKVLSSFCRKYRLGSVAAANALGHWSKPKVIEDLGWVSEAEFAKAAAFFDIIANGRAHSDYTSNVVAE